MESPKSVVDAEQLRTLLETAKDNASELQFAAIADADLIGATQYENDYDALVAFMETLGSGN